MGLNYTKFRRSTRCIDEFPLNTPQTDSPSDPAADPLALLRQLEGAGPDRKADQSGRAPATWRGFAFTIEDLNLAVPLAEGLQTAPGREVWPLPLCREWVRGMIAVDGEVYTVIDFARFIGRRPVPSAVDAGLLLMPGDGFNSALLLDSRIGLRSFRNDSPAVTPTDFDPALAPFLSTALMDGGQSWGVLDVAALRSVERFVRIGRTP